MGALRTACEDWHPNPSIIFSALGHVRNAHLRVPVEEAVEELIVDDTVLGVKFVEVDAETFKLQNLAGRMERPPDDSVPENDVNFDPKPHWYTDEVYEGPLTLLYGHGGMATPSSTPNYHIAFSGCESRPLGRCDAFISSCTSQANFSRRYPCPM